MTAPTTQEPSGSLDTILHLRDENRRLREALRQLDTKLDWHGLSPKGAMRSAISKALTAHTGQPSPPADQAAKHERPA